VPDVEGLASIAVPGGIRRQSMTQK
jgi:hypothetical protein